MKHLRQTNDDTSVTGNLARLRINQRSEQLVAGEHSGRPTYGKTATLTQTRPAAKRAVKAAHGLTAQDQDQDVIEAGTGAARGVGRAAAKGGDRSVRYAAETTAKKSLGLARDGRAHVRARRQSKALRGGLVAQQRRKVAAEAGKDIAAVIGTSAPRLSLMLSRAGSAAVTLVRTTIAAVISAFTGSPLLLLAVTVIGLVMTLLASISWFLPGAANTAIVVTGTWANPVMGTITSPYGLRTHPIFGTLKLHDGTDIGAPNGTPVNAACSGLIVTAGPAVAYGDHYVIIDCGAGVFTKYGHMDSQKVAEGDAVAAGQQVGTVGSQGYSTGNHLHFIVEVNGATTDPAAFFGDRGILLGQTPLEQMSGGDTGGSAKEYAASVLNDDDQFTCLDLLWTNESNWNPRADNPTSSAYGIPQALPGEKMASAGADWRTNPITQVKWGLSYIADRYKTPCKAWSFWQSNSPHWY